MPNRVAVMDLGTNTFHLLIAEHKGDGFTTLCHLQNPTRLGEDGLPNGNIKPEAYERGIAALKKYKNSIDKFKPGQVKAIGTSALRSAGNGTAFVKQVKAETGIEIISIDGDTEAGYIFKGVNSTGILTDVVSLILDIGGGSIEFIIADKNQIYWKRSYEIGAARLMKRFHLSDPIHPDEISNLQNHLDDVLKEVFVEMQKHNVKNIVGSSGAFETFAELAELKKGNTFDLKTTKSYRFDIGTLSDQLDYLITSTHDERAANKHILAVRVDMIVVASVVTRYLMHKLAITDVAMSVYSLKEGVLAEMLG